MAIWTTIPLDQLAGILVISPERYDPRRQLATSHEGEGCVLGDLVALNRKTVKASATSGECVILDTGDAREGIVNTAKTPVPISQIGSHKKSAAAGDVIISRLRPYLRQVAWVDAEAVAQSLPLLVSTEFFVLRPLCARSLAFLIPLLLSEPVQTVLAVAQEGGHHPRFNEQTLLSVPVPDQWLEQRDSLSSSVEQAVALHRQHQDTLRELIRKAESLLST